MITQFVDTWQSLLKTDAGSELCKHIFYMNKRVIEKPVSGLNAIYLFVLLAIFSVVLCAEFCIFLNINIFLIQ